MRIEGLNVAVATVRCAPSGREISVQHDSALIDAIHQLHLSLGEACEGVGLCGFCRVHVLEGLENLTPMAEEERKVLASLHADDDERLACLAKLRGPVTVTADYW